MIESTAAVVGNAADTRVALVQ